MELISYVFTELGDLCMWYGDDGNLFIQQNEDLLVLTQAEAELFLTALDLKISNEEED